MLSHSTCTASCATRSARSTTSPACGRSSSREPDGRSARAATSRTTSERCSHATRRSEEHTSELQSPCNLVCRLLLEKKKKNYEHSTHNDSPNLLLAQYILQVFFHIPPRRQCFVHTSYLGFTDTFCTHTDLLSLHADH